jgi:uncharacterized protein (TIGR04551 family)
MQNGSVVSILVAGAVILASVDGAAQPAPVDPPAKPAAPAPKPAAPAPKPAAPAAKPAPDAVEAEDEGAAPAEEEPAEAEAEGAEGAAGETRLPEAAPQAAPSPFGPMQMWPQRGAERETRSSEASTPTGAKRASADEQIFAEDWWSHTRPALELHGYFRVRAELFHNFSLGRIDPPRQQIWPMPADNYYANGTGNWGPQLCTTDESGQPGEGRGAPCKNKTQAGANMRFRLNPELHISDNLRVVSQVDLLDNLVLGSTPVGYNNQPGDDGGWSVKERSGYTPLGALDDTQEPPSAGINSLRDSIRVKRAWAEYMTPVGELRFGRMPDHWGLGMMINSGDGYDDDYQSTVDRIQFTTSIKPLDLYLSGAWDFVNEGVTSDSLALPQAQPYDLAQLDDVDQYTLMIARKKSDELTKLSLAQGGVVLNGGLRVTHRRQHLANDNSGSCSGPNPAAALDCGPEELSQGFSRRGASAWIPDLWFQLRYKKFRFEAEAAAIRGSIENVANDSVTTDDELDIEQYGVATEIEQRLVEDRLKLQFKFGWASGDGDVGGTRTGAPAAQAGSNPGLTPGFDGLQQQFGDDTMSTFRFHPSYRVDLLLNRNILTRVQGVYYFRPSVDYDFMQSPNGQRLGGSFAAIWTRASQFTQTPGHKRDLGVELNLSIYFQSKDGGLNDDLDKMGGFYTMLQYGVLFPLGGMGYPSARLDTFERQNIRGEVDTSAAQMLRWYLGVMF